MLLRFYAADNEDSWFPNGKFVLRVVAKAQLETQFRPADCSEFICLPSFAAPGPKTPARVSVDLYRQK